MRRLALLAGLIGTDRAAADPEAVAEVAGLVRAAAAGAADRRAAAGRPPGLAGGQAGRDAGR